jgi:hypothetical protein
MIRRILRLLLVHAPANALLLWLAYEWLGVDETNTGRLLLSAVDALAILALVCWLWGATLVWFRAAEPRLNDSFRTALRHLGGLLALSLAALALYGLAAKAAAALPQPALKVASWLTWTLRTPIKPAWIAAIFTAIVWLLRWAVLPVLLLPAAAAIAERGRAGWSALRPRRTWRQWIAMPLLALAALWLPLVLLNWKPIASGFGMELTSFTLRALLAYLLFVGALLTMTRAAAE